MSNEQIVTIKAVYTDTKDRNDMPLVSSKGNPYVRVTIDTHEFGRMSKNIFNKDEVPNFQANQKVRLAVSQRTFNGKIYYDWNYPKNPYDATKVAQDAMQAMHNSGISPAGLEPTQIEPTPPPPMEQFPMPERPRSKEEEARGKTRCQVAIAFINSGLIQGGTLTDDIKAKIANITDYIMTG